VLTGNWNLTVMLGLDDLCNLTENVLFFKGCDNLALELFRNKVSTIGTWGS